MKTHRKQLLRLDFSRGDWIGIDVSPKTAALAVFEKGLEPPRGGEPEGRDRNSLLLFRKHLTGSRLVLGWVDDPGGSLGGEHCRFLFDTADGASVQVSFRPKAPAAVTLCAGELSVTFGPGPGIEASPTDAAPELAQSRVAHAPLAGLQDARHAAAGRYIERVERVQFEERAVAERRTWKAAVAKAARLEAAIERDRSSWPSPEKLRRDAEALLASGRAGPHPEPEITIGDPWGGPDRNVVLRRDLTIPQNADALFARARRLEARVPEIEARLARVRAEREEAQARLDRVLAARTLGDLEAEGRSVPSSPTRIGAAKRRRYLTSGGFSLWVGRSASESHELTFRLSSDGDLWIHARDARGAHVILRSVRRVVPRLDILEAASVAAFYSERHAEVSVDVHVVERRHLRPVKGSKGRVTFSTSETVRVRPRDPEGWLRIRS